MQGKACTDDSSLAHRVEGMKAAREGKRDEGMEDG